MAERIHVLDLIKARTDMTDADGNWIITGTDVMREWARQNKIEDAATKRVMAVHIEALLMAKDTVAAANEAYDAAREGISQAETLAFASDDLTAFFAEVLDDPEVKTHPKAQAWLARASILMVRR